MTVAKPHKGCFLVSEPFLPDPDFYRTVILVAEHNEAGTVGYVLNHETVLTVSDLFDDFPSESKVYLGGPVGQNSFHYLHGIEGLPEAGGVLPGLYWGGDFNQLKFLMESGLVNDHQIRFFAGYSGWGAGQLEQEIEQKSWIVVEGNADLVFMSGEDMWKQVLADHGGKFSWMSNAPGDVNLN